MENKVAIYIRVSTNHQIDKDSIPMQERDLIAYSNLILNTDQYEVFIDAGYSGKDTSRPKYIEMMDRVRKKEFTHVLVWKIDRISRNLLDFAKMYAEIKALGVTFVSKNEQFDTSTAMGEAMLKIILVFAELERNMTSERVKATMISRAEQGKWNGGKIPFGYLYDTESKEFSIDESKVDLIKKIHNLYLETKSLVEVTSYLNDNSFQSKNNKKFSLPTVYKILKSVFYCGDYSYLSGQNSAQSGLKPILVKDHHPAIISREVKEHIIALLENNKRVRKPYTIQTDYIHLFAGILTCSCGRHYSSTPGKFISKDRRYSVYICPNSRLTNLSNCKSTSDNYLCEFVLNYVLKIYKLFDLKANITEEIVLSTICKLSLFRNVKTIENAGTKTLSEIILENKKNNQKSSSLLPEEKKSLLEQKETLIAALNKLKNIYLYNENNWSESDFFLEERKILENLNDIHLKLGIEPFNSDIIKAENNFYNEIHHFLTTHKFNKYPYINYKLSIQNIDQKNFRDFISFIFDTIVLDNGRIQQVILHNGVIHKFTYSD